MIEKASYALMKRLIASKYIAEEDREIYQYGLMQLLDFVINIATVIAIGSLLGMIWQGILFFIAFIPLRRMAGGYHAPNPQTCYLMSIFLIFISLMLIRYIDINLEILIGTIIISLIIFIMRAPIESRNKPLNAKERATYRKGTVLIAILEYMITLVLYSIGWGTACNCVVMAFFISATLLLFSDKLHEHV